MLRGLSRPRDEQGGIFSASVADQKSQGISLNLNIFREKVATPNFRLVDIPEAQMQTITVSPETARVRPLVAGAILRNIKFTPARYNSFISLQDHLHRNLARMRTLVSIGTHDLDTVQGPFTYEAHTPKDVSFIPLNQTKKMNGDELMAFYDKDRHLGRYLHIIRDKPVYPVIYDAKKPVMSLPPIINVGSLSLSLSLFFFFSVTVGRAGIGRRSALF
jgi:phenylalanyl-tRNA synthetase beta chain